MICALVRSLADSPLECYRQLSEDDRLSDRVGLRQEPAVLSPCVPDHPAHAWDLDVVKLTSDRTSLAVVCGYNGTPSLRRPSRPGGGLDAVRGRGRIHTVVRVHLVTSSLRDSRAVPQVFSLPGSVTQCNVDPRSDGHFVGGDKRRSTLRPGAFRRERTNSSSKPPQGAQRMKLARPPRR